MRLAASLPQESPRRAALRWLGLFTLLVAAVVALFLLRYALSIPSVDGAAAWIFLALTIAGHSLLLAALIALPLLLLALAGGSRRALTWGGSALCALLFLALAVDSSVYRLYRFHLNGMVWELLTGGAATEILPKEASFLTLAAALPLGAALLAFAGARAAGWLADRRVSPVAPLALLAACLATANLMHAWADAAEELEVASLARVFPANRLLTAKRALRRVGWADRTTARTMKAPSRGGLAYPRGEVGPGPDPSRLNVLVIMLDGWRQDDFGPEVTPRLFEYARRGQVYTDHWSTGNATRFGVFGFFYGIHATYWHDLLAAQRPPVLIETARTAGYRFGVFASAPLTSPEFDRTVFVSLRDRIALSTPGADPLERDREITRRFEAFLDQGGDAPFLSFLFYDSTHLYAFPEDHPAPFRPYADSVNHVALGRSSDPVPIHNRLRNSYHFVDGLAGRAIAALEAKGLLDRTVVIITGDHGEEMNDTGNGFWGHNSGFTRHQSAVPFVTLWPGSAPARLTHRTSHADVVPTLMRSVFDCRAEVSAYASGRPLLDTTPRPFVIVSNWDSFALVQPGASFVSQPTGALLAVDDDYRPLKGRAPSREVMLEALRELGGFYRKQP